MRSIETMEQVIHEPRVTRRRRPRLAISLLAGVLVAAGGVGLGWALSGEGSPSSAGAGAGATPAGSSLARYAASVLPEIRGGTSGGMGAMMGGQGAGEPSDSADVAWMLGGVAAPGWMMGEMAPGG